MIIESVTISQFQSIRHAHLTLGPWTSIVGESDLGKSAVWRAITAALTNRTGDSFIRHGQPTCEVTINLVGGDRIDWQKSRGKSGVYQVTLGGSAEVVRYEKTNGEVPAAVRALINVSLEVAGETLAPGLQGQHDRAFLLADTARRRQQVLGEFDGSNIALAAETILRTAQRTTQASLRAAEGQADTARAALLEYAGLDAARTALEAAEGAAVAHGHASDRVSRLRGLLQGSRVAHVRAEGYTATAQRATLPAGLPTTEDLSDLVGRVQAGHKRVAHVRFMAAAALTDERAARQWALPATTGALLEGVTSGTQRAEALRVALTGIAYHRRQAAGAAAILEQTPPPALPLVDALLTQGEQIRRLRAAVTALQGKRAVAETSDQAVEVAREHEDAARAELLGLAGQACPECGQPLTAAGLGG